MTKTSISVSDNVISVTDSFLYNKKEIKETVDAFYKDLSYCNVVQNRTRFSFLTEWYTYNLCYSLNVKRGRTSTVDFEYPQKFIVGLLYRIIGSIAYFFIK